MEIYIDESGVFARPNQPRRSISCVAALVVPAVQRRTLLERFGALGDRWLAKEVKGRDLDEGQVKKTINLCRRYDPLLFVRAIDLRHQEQRDLDAFRVEQANRLTRDLTSEHKKSVKDEAAEAADYMRRMPDHLLIQAILTVQLVDDVLRHAILYYSLRLPDELGAFRWRVDAKDHFETESEKLWKRLMLPFLQTMSGRNPHVQLTEGDYSHLAPFEADEIPDYVRHYAAKAGYTLEPGARPMDLAKVLQDFEIVPSESEIGLQVVDALASTVRRATMGRLSQASWSKLGSLMCSRIQMTRLSLDTTAEVVITDKSVIREMTQVDRRLKRVRLRLGP